jgi:predicted TIM-barrel fold metal-dependent hydrolase
LNRIDVHHHIVPPPYLARERERILAAMDMNPAQLLEWTPGRALEEIDRHGIATAITSISTPGIWFGEASAARTLARECNEYAAQLARDHPGRFGNFAAIPLPDVEGSLREIEYALDVLGADGIGILTSYADKWPGDPAFAPVFDELERRKAVVFVHPTAPACCRNLIPGIPPAITEFLFDTTRAVMSLLVGGTFRRCPNIRFIFCHAGGTMTVLSSRIDAFVKRHPELSDLLPDGALPELRRLYYDLANSVNAPAFRAVTALVPATQLLFGSDFPYVPIGVTAGGISRLDLDPQTQKAIERENALRLFPRYAASA